MQPKHVISILLLAGCALDSSPSGAPVVQDARTRDGHILRLLDAAEPGADDAGEDSGIGVIVFDTDSAYDGSAGNGAELDAAEPAPEASVDAAPEPPDSGPGLEPPDAEPDAQTADSGTRGGLCMPCQATSDCAPNHLCLGSSEGLTCFPRKDTNDPACTTWGDGIRTVENAAGIRYCAPPNPCSVWLANQGL